MAYYKELIKNLHICTSGDCFGCTLRTNKVNCKDLLLASVEGVIEQLIKERDAEPVRHGHWIEQSDVWGDVYYDCSACGNSWTTIDGTPFDNGMNYCPNCGAKMDEEDNT